MAASGEAESSFGSDILFAGCRETPVCCAVARSHWRKSI